MAQPQQQSQAALHRATSAADLKAFAMLVREYYVELDEDLCFQGLDQELDLLPGCYEQPGGCIILASCGSEHVGCVGIRPLKVEESTPPATSSASALPDSADGPASNAGDPASSPAGGSASSGAAPASSLACEMKRLYVRPGWRGTGVGRALVAEALAAARSAGYSSMLLDTLERLEGANRM